MWSLVANRNSYRIMSDAPCQNYEAVDGPPSSLDGRSTIPVLCVEVAASSPSSSQGPQTPSPSKAERCYEVDNLGGGPPIGLYTWALQSTPARPPIPGAFEKVLRGPDGQTVYGLGLDRSRLVGPASEDMCYLISLTVPKDSQISEADANSLLASFQFR